MRGFSRSLPSPRLPDPRGMSSPWRIPLSCEGGERGFSIPLPPRDDDDDLALGSSPGHATTTTSTTSTTATTGKKGDCPRSLPS